MQKRSGYVVVLPCCVSCLSVLIFLLALHPHTRKPKSTNFGWNPGCLHKNGKHLCWPRSSFVSTLRHVTHVRSQAKKQSTILLNCSLPNAFYSFLRQQRIHSLGMLRPSCGKTYSSTLHHISIIWYDVRNIKSQAEQIVDWPWLAKTTATPSVLTFKGGCPTQKILLLDNTRYPLIAVVLLNHSCWVSPEHLWIVNPGLPWEASSTTT